MRSTTRRPTRRISSAVHSVDMAMLDVGRAFQARRYRRRAKATLKGSPYTEGLRYRLCDPGQRRSRRGSERGRILHHLAVLAHVEADLLLLVGHAQRNDQVGDLVERPRP